MQTFTREAPKAVANYADSQTAALAKQLGSETDSSKRVAIQAELGKWKEGGAYRVALHAATGAIAGGIEGAIGAGTVAAAAPMLTDLQNNVVEKLKAAGVNETVAKGAAQVIATTTAAAVGAATTGGSAQGAAVGMGVDANNRQLHPEEKLRIKQLAGKDAVKEARLTAAACAIAKCYAEYPVDSATYQQLKQLADIGASDALAGERQQLSNQPGMFGYSTTGLFSDANVDAAKRLNNTYQIDTRVIGAGQMVLGSLGIAGSVATAPVSCATGVGCVANAVVGTVSADTAYAGAKQVVSGAPENTYLNQGLQGLGMSPEAAGLVELALGGGSAVITGRAVTKTIGSNANTITATANANASSQGATKGAPSNLGTADALLSDADFAGRGAVRADLTDHLVNAYVLKNQISGGHNSNNFAAALTDAGGKVTSRIEIAPGIYQLEYQLPGAAKSYPKTVYDPTMYSDATMADMANTAANKALIQYKITGNTSQKVVINGIEFSTPVRIQNGQPYVPTAYPIGVKK